MTAPTSYHASAEPPRQPIPGANWPQLGTALEGQLGQPKCRNEADPPLNAIQSAGAGAKTQQYGISGEAGQSGSVANAGRWGEGQGLSARLREAPSWLFCFRKMQHAPDSLPGSARDLRCGARSQRDQCVYIEFSPQLIRSTKHVDVAAVNHFYLATQAA